MENQTFTTQSLNGYDLIAIANRFGKTAADLERSDRLSLGYALLFIKKRREGLNDGTAYEAAMNTPMSDLHTELGIVGEAETFRDGDKRSA